MSAGFVHLHVHTQHSLLDGAIRVSDLLAKCKEYGMDSVAITDHGAMHGALEFYTKARKAGIKPIIGCEFYIAPGDRKDKKAVDGTTAFHIILLAMDIEGYQNLMKLASIAQFEGFYYKPRIDMEVLRQYNDGLIAMTACLHGWVPWLILQKDMAGAKKKTAELQEIFGDRLYFELQENGMTEQQTVNDGLIAIGREMGVKLVATNDCHYLNREEAHAHEVLLCIQTGKTINDPKRFRFSTDELYFKSPEIMKKSFAYCPEAIANTLEIADRCNLEIDFGDYHFPNFPVPEGETLELDVHQDLPGRAEGAFRHHAQDRHLHAGDRETLHRTAGVRDRGDQHHGFSRLLPDRRRFHQLGQRPRHPGRSGPRFGGRQPGRLLHAHHQYRPDPLRPDLRAFPQYRTQIDARLRCRFLPGPARRGHRLCPQQIRRRPHVAQIVTYGTMKARGVIRDVGRALDIPYGEVDKIAKLVPEQLKMTIKKAMEEEPKLQELADKDPRSRSCCRSRRPWRAWPATPRPMPPALSSRPDRWSSTCRSAGERTTRP